MSARVIIIKFRKEPNVLVSNILGREKRENRPIRNIILHLKLFKSRAVRYSASMFTYT